MHKIQKQFKKNAIKITKILITHKRWAQTNIKIKQFNIRSRDLDDVSINQQKFKDTEEGREKRGLIWIL